MFYLNFIIFYQIFCFGHEIDLKKKKKNYYHDLFFFRSCHVTAITVHLEKFQHICFAIFLWLLVILIICLHFIFWFMISSSLQQNHFPVILRSCQNILLAKSSMQKYGMKKPDGEVFFN